MSGDSRMVGYQAEMEIAYLAAQNGISVNKPLMDGRPYDFIFDVCNKLIKIQVKQGYYDKKKDLYMVDIKRCGSKGYQKYDFDFLIVLLDTKDTYVVPMDIVQAYKKRLVMIPHRESNPTSFKYGKDLEIYRNAWSQLL